MVSIQANTYSFPVKQNNDFIEDIRHEIFFLLLLVDPKTSKEYDNVDINEAFDNTIDRIFGYNRLLGESLPVINTLTMLKSAQSEYNKPDSEFNYKRYRKLILDSGNEIMRAKVGD